MTRLPLPDRATFAALVSAKILLVGLMVIGAVAPHVGGFAGKGIGYRLPVYIIPVLVVPMCWLCGKSWNAALDIGLRPISAHQNLDHAGSNPADQAPDLIVIRLQFAPGARLRKAGGGRGEGNQKVFGHRAFSR